MNKRKPLSEMTLQELWELFPIILTEHKSCWPELFKEEKQKLTDILPENDIKINHIGSTAIQNIQAKPIIDILLEIPEEASMTAIKEILLTNGYTCMSEEKHRKSFNKGYTSEGFAEKVFHLHLRYNGDNPELYFRDYLNEHPELAKEYEKLKISLQKQYKHNRDAYTEAKTAFINKNTELAKKRYSSRYK